MKNKARTAGICLAEDCGNTVYARGYCVAHYTRLRRNGHLDIRMNRYREGECIYIGCAEKPNSSGYCTKHARYVRESETGTPYKAKVIRLCGIDGCEKTHAAHGLCSGHLAQWKKAVKDYEAFKASLTGDGS